MRLHVKRVQQAIDDTLGYCSSGTFRTAVQAVLHDRFAADARAIPWFMLPILVYEALKGKENDGNVEPAYHLAAGLEIGRVAAGCLDEWQDRDTDDALWQQVGPEQTVNLATGMIALSMLAPMRLTELGVGKAQILDLQVEFQLTLLRMSEGQYADLGDDICLDDYEVVAGAKTGALFRLGCRAGAIAAGAQTKTVATYGDFGYRVGLLVQVWNDIAGLAGVGVKRDAELQRGLPSLATMAMEGAPTRVGDESESSEGQAGQLFTMLQLALYHQQASDALARCPEPGGLPSFLDQFSPDRLADLIEKAVSQREHKSASPAV